MSSDAGADEAGAIASGSCPSPIVEHDRIVLGHGSGGRLSHRLLESVILPAFGCPALDRGDDQAIVDLPSGRVAFTTDSYVVTPLFFPGGDIGTLAVHGTVNDLAVGGARPLYLSVSFILEEGLPMPTLRRVVASIQQAARACQVQIVTGDTKVVSRGAADQLFVNTSGIGVVPAGVQLSADQARPGDVVLVSGTVGDHGLAVLAAREDLGLGPTLVSDSTPLHDLTSALLACGARVRCMRDPTRGGVAAALTEIAGRARVGFTIDEAAVPLSPAVRGACELLGMDPLLVANEGKLIAIVAREDGETALAALRASPLGRAAACIGSVTSAPGEIVVRTRLGTSRSLDLPLGDPLPRIC